MHSTAQLLDLLKSRHDVGSDRQLRLLLGVSQQTISAYRLGRNFFDDAIAIRVAELLDLDPAYVMACAHAERSRNPDVRKIWERIARGASAAALALMMIGTGAIDAARSLSLYIMLSIRRAWKVIIIAAPVLFIADAHAADNWSDRDVSMQTAYTVLHVVDWMQTIKISERLDVYYEKNPILGTDPTRSEINTYFASTLALHFLVTHFLPREARPYFQSATIAIQASAVRNNYNIGVRIDF